MNTFTDDPAGKIVAPQDNISPALATCFPSTKTLVEPVTVLTGCVVGGVVGVMCGNQEPPTYNTPRPSMNTDVVESIAAVGGEPMGSTVEVDVINAAGCIFFSP